MKIRANKRQRVNTEGEELQLTIQAVIRVKMTGMSREGGIEIGVKVRALLRRLGDQDPDQGSEKHLKDQKDHLNNVENLEVTVVVEEGETLDPGDQDHKKISSLLFIISSSILNVCTWCLIKMSQMTIILLLSIGSSVE